MISFFIKNKHLNKDFNWIRKRKEKRGRGFQIDMGSGPRVGGEKNKENERDGSA